jgi:magnesium chelatase family protein
MQVEVPRQPEVLKQQVSVSEPISPQWRQQVIAVRALQQQRQYCLNSEMRPAQLAEHCLLSSDDHDFLVRAIEQFSLSHRAYHRLLRLARTIADLDQSTTILRKHLAEALSFRALDRLLQQLKQL